MFKRIIVGLDGSLSSWNAVDYAFDLSKLINAPVIGVYVIDSRLINETFITDLLGFLGFTYYEDMTPKIREFLNKRADDVLNQFLDYGREKGVNVSVVKLEGVPYKELLDQTDRDDILFIGKRGEKYIKGFLLGSTSYIIAKKSKFPIFMTTAKHRNIERIAVAYDGRVGSKKLNEYAKLFMKVYNAEVHYIYVKESREIEDIETELLENLDFKFVFHGREGMPEEEIIDVCKEESIDLLIMGAFGKGEFKELIMGSTTSFIINNLDIPLLLVK